MGISDENAVVFIEPVPLKRTPKTAENHKVYNKNKNAFRSIVAHFLSSVPSAFCKVSPKDVIHVCSGAVRCIFPPTRTREYNFLRSSEGYLTLDFGR